MITLELLGEGFLPLPIEYVFRGLIGKFYLMLSLSMFDIDIKGSLIRCALINRLFGLYYFKSNVALKQ